MPEYLFKNPETEEIKSIIQRMNETHVYSENGIEWSRIFTCPQAIVDGKFNCWSESKFLEKTKNMKGRVGDVTDLSKELSEKRASEHDGIDPVKTKFFNDYSKLRKGKRHPSDKRTEVKKDLTLLNRNKRK